MQMWLWLTLALLLAGAEIFTAGFGLLWFGIAAVVAAGLAFLGVGIPGQLAAFGLIGLVLLYFTRRIVGRLPSQNLRTNVEAMPGQSGIALDDLTPGTVGYVQVGTDRWRATSRASIKAGMPVRISRVEGVTLHVEPMERLREG